MFIFIYAFPSQGSLCVNTGLLFDIYFFYAYILEFVILGYEHQDCWWLIGWIPRAIGKWTDCFPMHNLLKTSKFMEIVLKWLNLFMNRILAVLSDNPRNKTRAFISPHILIAGVALRQRLCHPSWGAGSWKVNTLLMRSRFPNNI